MRRPIFHRSLPAAMIIMLGAGLSGCNKGSKGAALHPASPDAVAAAASTPGGKVHPVSEADFNALAQVPDRLVVVDFYADWCGPCRELAPILQSLAAEFPSNVLFLKVNVDQNKALAKKHGVRGIPDLRFFLNGQQVDSIVGLDSAQSIRQKISKHAPEAKAASGASGVQADSSTTPPRGGIFGLLDKTRAGMENRAGQANLQPDTPTTSVAEKVDPANPQASPAPPPIRPIKADEEVLPAGMSRTQKR